MEDGKTLTDYNVQDADELNLLLSPSFKIEIKQDDVDFNTFTLMTINVRGSDTIDNIKAKIQDYVKVKEGNLNCMRLFKTRLEHDEDDGEDYDDDELMVNGKTLSDYNITEADQKMWIFVDWEGSDNEAGDPDSD